ncbi:hypothetical protein V6N13_020519 [Hibiscus sabdariffa]
MARGITSRSKMGDLPQSGQSPLLVALLSSQRSLTIAGNSKQQNKTPPVEPRKPQTPTFVTGRRTKKTPNFNFRNLSSNQENPKLRLS